MKQGDIYWHEFEPPDKRRPVLILTRSSAIRVLTGITVAPISSTIREIPSEVFLAPVDGLSTVCAANFDNIQTVRKTHLQEFIAHLSPGKMREVSRAIQFALGLDCMSS